MTLRPATALPRERFLSSCPWAPRSSSNGVVRVPIIEPAP